MGKNKEKDRRTEGDVQSVFKETAPKGLEIKINNMDALTSSLIEGDNGLIGIAFLPGEVKEVRCKAEAHKKNVVLTAQLFTKTNISYIREHLLKDNFTSKGDNLIAEGHNGTRFIVRTVYHYGKKNEKVESSYIKVGNGWGWNSESKEVLIENLPDKTEAEIKKALADYCEVIQKVIKLIDPGLQNESLILKTPSEMKVETEETLEDLSGFVDVETPRVEFAEIGGQTKAREEMEMFARALADPELYKKWGTKPPKGILLYGPPGTGKTLLAKALAVKAHAEFVHIMTSDIVTKWFGEAERNLQRIFDAANERSGKTIIFFDEIDALSPSRANLDAENHGDQSMARIVSTLNENLNGLNSNSNVFVIGATNRIEAIDKALLRPGRFDRKVEVPLPDVSGRKEILKIHMEKANLLSQRELFKDVNVDELAIKSFEYSGAELAEIIRRTLEVKLRQEMGGKTPDLVSTGEILLQMFGYQHEKEATEKHS